VAISRSFRAGLFQFLRDFNIPILRKSVIPCGSSGFCRGNVVEELPAAGGIVNRGSLGGATDVTGLKARRKHAGMQDLTLALAVAISRSFRVVLFQFLRDFNIPILRKSVIPCGSSGFCRGD